MIRTILLSLLMVVGLAGVALAQGNYTVRAGDSISIEVLEDPSLNRSALVLPDGRFSFPFAGSIQAGGRTTSQIARAITSGIESNFANTPTVFVSVANLAVDTELVAVPNGIDVYLIGEVNSPGIQQVERGTTLLQFLAASGGFTRFAATKRVQLRRLNSKTGASQLYNFNFKALTMGEALTQDIRLVDGDVVIVPERRLFE